MPKFINYGEIDDDDEDNEVEDNNLLNNTTSVDIEDIKSNTEDINKKSSKSADLDSLLNISTGSNNKESKFITPAEGIVKNDQNIEEKNEDYFKTPDLVSVELPSEIQTKDTESVSIKELEEKRESQKAISADISTDDVYTIQTAVEKLRKFVNELNDNNLKADIEEMNFSKSYQIIIKLDKTEE